MLRRGFTLVELLIVLGIVSVLIAILIPALSRARQMSQRMVCLGHLRSLGAAMIAYANDNETFMPAGARAGDTLAEDWIYWEPGRVFGQGPFTKYDGTDLSAYRCPSDDTTPREAAQGYAFSYAMNAALMPIPTGGTHAYGLPLRKIKGASGKILAFDESESSVDDGWGVLDPTAAKPEWTALRHDPDRMDPDKAFDPAKGNTNLGVRCNVVFCDGHADWITRGEAQSQPFFDPNY